MDVQLSPAARADLRKKVSQVMEVCGKNYDEEVLADCVVRLGNADAVVEGIFTQSLPKDLMERLQDWKEMTPQRKSTVVQSPPEKKSSRQKQRSGTKTAITTPIKRGKSHEQQKESKTIQSSSQKSTPSQHKCYIRNLDLDLDEAAIKHILETSLETSIHLVHIPKTEPPNKNNGFAYVTFANANDAAAAVATSDYEQQKKKKQNARTYAPITSCFSEWFSNKSR